MKASAPVLVVARIALTPGDADAALEHARACRGQKLRSPL